MAQISDLPGTTAIDANDMLAIDRASDSKTRKTRVLRLAAIVSKLFVVQSMNLTASPVGVEGNFYVMATGTLTGDWSTFTSLNIAFYSAGSWVEIAAAEGMKVYDENTGVEWIFNGTKWTQTSRYISQVVSSASGTLVVDFSQGNWFKTTLTENITTITITDPDKPTTIYLEVVQGGAGTYTITWPASVKWPSFTPPTITTGVGKTCIIPLHWNGTYYFGEPFWVNYL